jgi:dual specificity phosphatase 12
MRFLAEKRIAAVLSVCTDFVPAEDPTLGIWHLRLPIASEPGDDLLVELPRAVAFITQALVSGRAVLVHSQRGQSRSATVVAAYRECQISTLKQALIPSK